MFIILQSFPEEKILFASNSELEAKKYFNLQVQHGKGWFELWKEGNDVPIQADGDGFYAPYNPDNWNTLRKEPEHGAHVKDIHYFPAENNHRLIVTTWE